MSDFVSILFEALMLVSSDLALFEQREPSQIAAVALFSSSLRARTIGAENLIEELKRLQPDIYSILSEITETVNSSEN